MTPSRTLSVGPPLLTATTGRPDAMACTGDAAGTDARHNPFIACMYCKGMDAMPDQTAGAACKVLREHTALLRSSGVLGWPEAAATATLATYLQRHDAEVLVLGRVQHSPARGQQQRPLPVKEGRARALEGVTTRMRQELHPAAGTKAIPLIMGTPVCGGKAGGRATTALGGPRVGERGLQ